MREQYWSEVAEAKARIHRRSHSTPHQALEADQPPTVPAETVGQADAASAPVGQPAAAKPRRAHRPGPRGRRARRGRALVQRQ